MKICVLVNMFLLLCSCSLCGQSYYVSIDGEQGGENLKTVLYNLVKEHTKIDYNSGNMWGSFRLTDVVTNTENQVWDMYSNNVRYYNGSSAVSGMNIEHSVPNSWWGGTKNNAYSDLHHLNPADQAANSAKSNYPLGEVYDATFDNGVSRVGKASQMGGASRAFEPADEYKGDFARAYMYMATCYQDLTWKYTYMFQEKSTYPTLQPWAVDLLLSWNRQDPVSQKEIQRNAAVYNLQRNRNPYIDYPQLADYVWGDSVCYIFHLNGEVELGDSTLIPGGGGEEPGGGDGMYELITDESMLEEGSVVIITACGTSIALSTEQKSNNRGVTGVEIEGNEIVSISDDVQLLTIHAGAQTGTFAFYTGSGYLYAASSSSNYLRTESSLSNNSSWLISVSAEGQASIVAQGNYTRNTMQYNAGSTLFASYASATQSPLSIYKEKASSSLAPIETDTPSQLIHVYSLNGRLVKTVTNENEALNGLSKGIYIVNGKKRLIK